MLDIELAVSNYRCFGDEPSRIRISDGFTALLGTNNAGKSSLLRMPYELRHLFSYLGMQSNNAAHLASLLSKEGVNTDSLGMPKVARGERIFRAGVDKPIVIDVTVHDSSSGPWDLGGKKVTLSITYTADRIHGRIKSDQGQILDTYERAPSAVRDSMQPVVSAGRELAQSMYVGPFRNAINVGSQESYYDIQTGDAFIRTFAGYKSGPVPEQNEAMFELLQEIGRIFGYKSLDVNPAEDYHVLQLTVDGRSYRLGEQGAGLAHFIVVLANVLVRRPSLLFIDEPELNLHASLQLDFLQTLAQYTKHGVVFATHSLGLARTAADRIYSLAKPVDGTSVTRPYEADRELVTLLGQLSFDKRPDLGFSKVLLVEGKSELRTLMQLLRLYGKEHSVLMLSLHGNEMIRGDVGQELAELLRIGGDVRYLIDSERTAPDVSLATPRQEFVDLCKRLGIDGHVLERRALENYFPEAAVSRSYGASVRALAPYEKKGPSQNWPKTQNWRIAAEMGREDLDGTDLGDFLEAL